MEKPIRYRPTSAQLALRKLIREKTRILAYGGSRSGKTFEFCHALAAIGMRYGGRYAVFRRYFNAVKNSVFDDTFPKMFELSFPGVEYRRNLSDARIVVPDANAEFWFVGLDDDRRVERILGREFATARRFGIARSSTAILRGVRTGHTDFSSRESIRRRAFDLAISRPTARSKSTLRTTLRICPKTIFPRRLLRVPSA